MGISNDFADRSFSDSGNLKFGLSGAALSTAITLGLDDATKLPIALTIDYCALHM